MEENGEWAVENVRGDVFELRNTSQHPRADVLLRLRGTGAVGAESRWRKRYGLVKPGEAVQFIFLYSPRLQSNPSILEISFREMRNGDWTEAKAVVRFPGS